MITNSIIYRYADNAERRNIKGGDLRKATLETASQSADGTQRKRLEGLRKLAHNEEIKIKKSTKDHQVLTVRCEFLAPRLLAGGEPPYVPVTFDMWVNRKTPMVTTFNAGRRLSAVGLALLGHATSADPGVARTVKLDRDGFKKLRDWAVEDPGGGRLQSVVLHDTEADGTKFKRIALVGAGLENSRLTDRLFKSAGGVISMGITTPKLQSGRRAFSCRMNYWGSFTLYTAAPTDGEIAELLEAVEDNVFAPVVSQ